MKSERQPNPLRWVWILPLGWLIATMAVPRPAVESTREADPRTVGPQACAECHVEEFGAWQASKHQLGSKTLTRNPASKEIASALGIRRVKSDARCTTCHFTMQAHGEKEKAVAGVSCESCHGPAKEWIDAHDDQANLAHCDSAGMKRPGKLYDLAAQCYVCHTIDDEELVNVGGHPTGAKFELVCYTQGEVLHNYVRGSGENATATLERKRTMFVLGMMLELEHALRALAAASGPGAHATALRERASKAILTLHDVQARVANTEIETALSAVTELKLEPGDADLLMHAADAVGAAARAFPEDLDLASIDSLLPPPEMVVGTPAK